MTDNKNKKGKADRNKVAGNEPYEVSYLANELNVSTQQVVAAIKVVGNERKKVTDYIKSKK